MREDEKQLNILLERITETTAKLNEFNGAPSAEARERCVISLKKTLDLINDRNTSQYPEQKDITTFDEYHTLVETIKGIKIDNIFCETDDIKISTITSEEKATNALASLEEEQEKTSKALNEKKPLSKIGEEWNPRENKEQSRLYLEKRQENQSLEILKLIKSKINAITKEQRLTNGLFYEAYSKFPEIDLEIWPKENDDTNKRPIIITSHNDADILCAICEITINFKNRGLTIEHLTTLEDFRRQGHATKIIRHCERIAKHHELTIKIISVKIQSQFYKQLGYTQDNTFMAAADDGYLSDFENITTEEDGITNFTPKDNYKSFGERFNFLKKRHSERGVERDNQNETHTTGESNNAPH
jgi:GNAT superfamily N-acetyltransferase